MSRRSPELLAPAGGPEAAWAALHYGADAIYAGLGRFSARAEAQNFTPESLEEVIQFAHQRRPSARVFVAVNTLILDRELRDVVQTVARAADAGADAFIVQDVGMVRLIRRHFPGVRLHASTQMAVHSLEGARALRDLGFARVVLARELTLAEIRRISRDSGLETEVFVHGALCYSYSGLCLFSSHALGRSGNRGRCAYCCREPFTVPDPEGNRRAALLPFSMKDLALADRLDDLREAGVTCLKIEGRMKSDLYVAAVTDYYRRRLDGRLTAPEIRALEEDIRTVFSRPWTPLYLGGENPDVIDPVNVGHRGAPVGRVDSVRSAGRGGAWLRFRTGRALEKHDGLQIDLPAVPRPFGFAVDELRLAPGGPGDRARRVIEAPAGSEVEVQLPAGHPPIPAGAVVYCSSSQAVKRSYRYATPRPGQFRQHSPIDVVATLAPSAFTFAATARNEPGIAAQVSMPGEFGKARDPGKTADALRQTLARLGDTEWALGSLRVEDPGGLFVPASVMNEARRRLSAELSARRRAEREEQIERVAQSLAMNPRPERPRTPAEWSLRITDANMLAGLGEDGLGGVGEIVVQLDSAGRTVRALTEKPGRRVEGDTLRLALPAICREADARALKPLIGKLWKTGSRKWEIANIGGFRLLAEATGTSPGQMDLTADWSLYTMNRQAAEQWIELGVCRFVLSPEDDERNMLDLVSLFGPQAIVPVFQYTPLFISESKPVLQAPLPGQGTARQRPRPPPPAVIVSKSGDSYAIRAEGGRTIICSERPFCLSGHLAGLRKAGACRFRVDLAGAPQRGGELTRLWRALQRDEEIPGSHRGNFRRGMA